MWTVDTLKEHLELRIADQIRYGELRASDSQRAVDKATLSLQKQVEDLHIADLLPRAEYQTAHRALEEAISRLGNQSASRLGANQTIFIILGLIAVLAAALVGHLLH